MLYLDNAATSLRKPLGVYASLFYNTVYNSVNAGHGGHSYSIRGAKGIYDAAEVISEFLNISDPEQIAFTYNATYALNLGIRGLIKPGEHVVTTCMEHNSVLRTLSEFCDFTMVMAEKDGEVTPQAIEAAIRPETRLIIVSHAANTCGTIQDIAEMGKIAKRHGIVFMVDAAQSIGTIEIDVQALGIDILAFSAHKGLLGPLGVGVLYVSPELELEPAITGGTGSDSKNLMQPRYMPDLLQSGTLNTPSIIACKSSIAYLKRRGVVNIGAEETYLAERFIENISCIPGITLYGKKKGPMRNGTVLFNINAIDSIDAAEQLNRDFSIAVRGGWHCAYQAHAALGSEKSGALRASFGAFNSVFSVEKLTDAVYKLSRNISY